MRSKRKSHRFSVGIRIKDSRYAEALSERLTELSGGLEIVLLKPEDTREVTVLIDDEVLSDIYSASDLFEWIMERAEENGGEPLHRSRGRALEIWHFCSLGGGTGASSIAFTAGRYLSAGFSKHTLYIDASGAEDFRFYIDCERDRNGNPEELLYRIRNGKSSNLERYFFKDSSGLYAASISSDHEKFVNAVMNDSETEILLIDWGKMLPAAETDFVNAENRKILIAGYLDLRYSFSDFNAEEHDMFIMNFSDHTSVSHDRAEVAYCPDAFIKKNSKVEIRMDSGFASGVGRIVREVIGDDG